MENLKNNMEDRLTGRNKIVQSVINLVPRNMRLWLNPNHRSIVKFMKHAASETAGGSKVLDAGAGPGPYKYLFAHCQYEATDFHPDDNIDFVCSLDKIPKANGTYSHIICFKEGTSVFTNGQIKDISEVKIGDKVFNSNGDLQIVKQVFKRDYEGDICYIKPSGLPEIAVTKNHLIKVTNIKRIHKKSKPYFPHNVYEWKINPPIWREAKNINIENDYLIIPRNREIKTPNYMVIRIRPNHLFKGKKLKSFSTQIPSKIKIDEKIAWMLGLWVAEGTTSKNRINFHLGAHETEIISKLTSLIKEKFNINPYVYTPKKKPESSSSTVLFHNKDLVSFLVNNFGKLSHNKKIANFIFNSNPKIIIEFLRGWFDGDGNLNKNKTCRISTCSKKLMLGCCQLLYNLKIAPSIYKDKRKTWHILDRTGNTRENYSISFPKQLLIPHKKRTYSRISRNDNDFQYIKITSKNIKNEKCKVYNLETEDNTYCVPFLVHNCTETIEHVEYPQDVMNEFYNILQPRGKLYLTCPQGWGLHQEPNNYFNFTKYGLKSLLKNAGFQEDNIYIQPKGGYFWMLSNIIRCGTDQMSNWNPIKWVLYPFTSIIIPLLLFPLDILDQKKLWTNGYLVEAKK